MILVFHIWKTGFGYSGQDKTLGKKFYEEDMNIIKTKNNVNYIEKMQFGEEVFYYQINKNPVLDADGNVMGIVGIV